MIRSSITQKCNYHGTRFCLYADTRISVCTLRAHTKEYTNKRERERNGEKFNAILRRFSIFVRRAYLGALTGREADSRGKMTVVLRTWILASSLSYLGSSSPYYTRNGPNPFGQVCLHPSSIGRVARLGTLKPAKDKTDNWLGMDSDFADLWSWPVS